MRGSQAKNLRFKCVCVLGKNNLHIRTQQKKRARSNMQYMHKRNAEARSCNRSCSEKAISITYCECVFVALGILRAKPMRCSTWPLLVYLDVLHVFTLTHKRHDLGGGGGK
jgi:hypothetical protein